MLQYVTKMTKLTIIIVAAVVSVMAIVLLLIFVVFKHEHTWSEWSVDEKATYSNYGRESRYFLLFYI